MATLTAAPYGQDTYCLDFIVPGVLVSGGVLLGQAAYRRLTSQRLRLEYDQDYGRSLAGWLGQAMTADRQASAPGIIAQELRKDERLAKVDVTIAQSGQNAQLLWTVTINALANDGVTGFVLVLAVTDITVSLLTLQGVGPS